MIISFIFGLSLLILACFIIDILSDKIKVPSVILLMLAGIVLHYTFNALYIEKAVQVLPILGTVALILVVIEAGFDLDYEPEKRSIILKAFFSALTNLTLCLVPITLLFQWFYHANLIQAVLYAIPFSIVSSAIAIPSAKSLDTSSKEFLTYETVFSDVLGILLFNLFSTTTTLSPVILFTFSGKLVGSVILSFVLSMLLVLGMKHVKHKVRFVPIFAMLVLIYIVGKYLGLPLLITMMVFGLVLNNIEKLEYPLFHIKLDKRLRVRINHFKRLTHEMTFVIRGLFFVMFGYRLELFDMMNPILVLSVVLLTAAVFLMRFGILKALRTNLSEGITFIAPRGLISILLMLSIPEIHRMDQFHTEFMDLFIILTILIQIWIRNYPTTEAFRHSLPGFLYRTKMAKIIK